MPRICCVEVLSSRAQRQNSPEPKFRGFSGRLILLKLLHVAPDTAGSRMYDDTYRYRENRLTHFAAREMCLRLLG